MYIWIVVISVCFAFLFFCSTDMGRMFVDFVRFSMAGRKKGFSYSELLLLWNVNLRSNKNARSHFFSSIRSLDFCIRVFQKEMEKSMSHTKAGNALLTKLYNYRTQFELELMQEKYHIESTHDMEIRQVCMLLSEKVGSIYVRVEEVTEDALKVVMFDSSANKAS